MSRIRDYGSSLSLRSIDMGTAVALPSLALLPPNMAWWRRVSISVWYRLQCWVAPKVRRNTLQIAHAREKVMSAAYVFLNAVRSGGELTDSFKYLRRQVKRLNNYAGVDSGISKVGMNALHDAARATAERERAKETILSFPREDLLFDIADTEEFARADDILLAMESRMATGIDLYGQLLRSIAVFDSHKDENCCILQDAMKIVLAREANMDGDAAQIREAWLGSAVKRLPERTLGQLGTVLNAADLSCRVEDSCKAFLEDLAPIVDKQLRFHRGD